MKGENKREEALKILKEEEQDNLKKCNQEISKILEKYGYTLEVKQNIALRKI